MSIFAAQLGLSMNEAYSTQHTELVSRWYRNTVLGTLIALLENGVFSRRSDTLIEVTVPLAPDVRPMNMLTATERENILGKVREQLIDLGQWEEVTFRQSAFGGNVTWLLTAASKQDLEFDPERYADKPGRSDRTSDPLRRSRRHRRAVRSRRSDDRLQARLQPHRPSRTLEGRAAYYGIEPAAEA